MPIVCVYSLSLFLSFYAFLSCLSFFYLVDQPCITAMRMMMTMMMMTIMTVRPNNLCLHDLCVGISRLNISMALLMNNLFILFLIPVESRLNFWYIFLILNSQRLVVIALLTNYCINMLLTSLDAPPNYRYISDL
jgi:hypothetical protein